MDFVLDSSRALPTKTGSPRTTLRPLDWRLAQAAREAGVNLIPL